MGSCLVSRSKGIKCILGLKKRVFLREKTKTALYLQFIELWPHFLFGYSCADLKFKFQSTFPISVGDNHYVDLVMIQTSLLFLC